MARLQAHDWPGNIRELRNVLDRARLFADDQVVRAAHLPATLGTGAATAAPPVPPLASALPANEARAGRTAVSDAELMQRARSSALTRRELAAQLGMSERTLYRRLKALGLL